LKKIASVGFEAVQYGHVIMSSCAM